MAATIVGGIEITDKVSRLIAADKAEEQGDMPLARSLRDTERPLSMRNGKNEWAHRIPTKEYPWIAGLARKLGYRKREVSVTVSVSVEITGTYWSGGSTYFEWHIEPSITAPIHGTQNGINPAVAPTVHLRTGFAVIQGGDFCGKPATWHIHIHADDAYRFGVEFVPGFPD